MKPLNIPFRSVATTEETKLSRTQIAASRGNAIKCRLRKQAGLKFTTPGLIIYKRLTLER